VSIFRRRRESGSVVGLEGPSETRPTAGPNEASDRAARYLDEARDIWHTYVPSRGQATTVQGELLRAVEKLRDEAHRNGNQNWDEGFEILAEYLRDTLVRSGIFDRTTQTEIEADIKRTLNVEHPEESDEPYDRLAERVVDWCRSHPEPVEHSENPHLFR
jgi:hypothetical protein